MGKQEEKAVSTPVKRLGKAHYIKTDKGLFPFSVLKEAELKKVPSKQIKDELRWLGTYGLIPHPYEYSALVELQENCSYFDSCVRTIAEDVVGAGWELVPREEGGEKVSDAERSLCMTLFDDTNSEGDTFDETLQRLIIDWGMFGQFALEVGRENKIANGLFHMQAHSIFIHKDREKFAQKLHDKKRWFKLFGLEEDIDGETGEPTTDPEKIAHEIIYHRNYSLRSAFYGQPPILPAIGAVVGSINVRNYNLAFFENYGVPAALVTLEGEWEEGTCKQISDFIDTEIKRTENAHKTIVLEMPEGGKVEWEPIVVEVKEGSFSFYFKSQRDEILSIYKMPPYRIGIVETGSLGGNIATEATKIYNQATIQPIKNLVGQLLSDTIIREGLGCENTLLRFKKMDTRDMDALIDRWVKLFGMAAINIDYIRGELNLEDKVDHGATYYIASQYLPVGEENFERSLKTLSKHETKEMVEREVKEALKRLGRAK